MKQFFRTIGVIIWGLCGFILLFMLWSRISENNYQNEQDKVNVSIAYDILGCTDKDYPLHVVIRNWTNKNILFTHFAIWVYQFGYSSDLAMGIDTIVDSDKIIFPSDVYGFCVKIPPLSKKIDNLSQLNYYVLDKKVLFQD